MWQELTCFLKIPKKQTPRKQEKAEESVRDSSAFLL